MSFLTPWFLAGLALVAGPIIAHLIRRATRERVTFSSLRFLEPSAPRLDRRSRVQHPWLLLLRCLIVALLAFGFARPFFPDSTTPLATSAPARHVVIVLDESASMQREGAWDAALHHVQQIVADLTPADRLAILTAGSRVNEILSAEQWLATDPDARSGLVRQILSSRSPGWGPTPLDAAAETALAEWEEMAESGETLANRELFIVSDFSAGSRIAGFATLDWPSNARVHLERITPAVLGNASLHWLGWSDLDPAQPAARIRFSRTFDAPAELRVQWRDAANNTPLGPPEPVTLLPGANEVRLLPLPENAPPTLRLDLEGDAQPFDNQLWLVRAQPRELPIVLTSTHPADSPEHAHFYLQRAITGWRDPAARIVAASPPAGPTLFLIDAPIAAADLDVIRSRVQAGAFALILLSNDELVATAATLVGETGWTPAQTERADALLGSLDFQHPLFAPFADPLYSDFSRIRFWQPRSVALPADTTARVIARFDDDSPAIIEAAVGSGRVVIWPGDWSRAASQWVLSSKFVPWLQALAERAVGGPNQPAIAELGSPVATEFAAAAPALGLTPGIHTSATSPSKLIALNVPAAESEPNALSLDVWEQLGVPLAESRAAAASTSPFASSNAAHSTEAQQQLWRWLLWLAVALLALESLSSFILARTTTSPAPLAPSP